MKVKLEVSPDSDIRVETDAEGNILFIEFEPFFTKKKGSVVLTYGTATNNNGAVLDRFALAVSGSNGRVTKTCRDTPVLAAVDAVVLTKTQPAKPEEEDK